MTPDKNFRMKSTTKTMIATMAGTKEQKAHFKKMMIEAQLQEEAAKRAALKSKDTSIAGKHSKEGVALD
jgi:hypothetical protein